MLYNITSTGSYQYLFVMGVMCASVLMVGNCYYDSILCAKQPESCHLRKMMRVLYCCLVNCYCIIM